MERTGVRFLWACGTSKEPDTVWGKSEVGLRGRACDPVHCGQASSGPGRQGSPQSCPLARSIGAPVGRGIRDPQEPAVAVYPGSGG